MKKLTGVALPRLDVRRLNRVFGSPERMSPGRSGTAAGSKDRRAVRDDSMDRGRPAKEALGRASEPKHSDSLARLSNMQCPVCRTVTHRSDKYFPFCSRRCQMVDLGMWAKEEYRIAGEPVEDEQWPEERPLDDDGTEPET